jgi:hypothetical protein
MKRTIIIIAVLGFCASLSAQNLISERLNLKSSAGSNSYVSVFHPVRLNDLSSFRKSELINNEFETPSSKLDITKVKDNLTQETAKKKSVLLGVLFSALVPGAGEFYGKDYLKAGIFFGVEVLSWGAYTFYQVKGNNQTDKFQNYADQYWSVYTYARWLVDQGFEGAGVIDPNEPNRDILRQQIMQCEAQNFTHTLPDYGSQQYYELIGKYQNFQAGWTNLAHVPTKSPGPYWYETYKDPVFVDYANERQKANDYYDYSKSGLFVVVVNHLLSAADAAWTVSMYNKKIKVETGFDIKRYQSPYTLETGNLPSFNMKITF